MASRSSTIGIVLRAVGAAQVQAAIQGVTRSAQQAGQATAQAGQSASSAWSPLISNLKKAEMEQKALADESQKTAIAKINAARRAAAAVQDAAKDEKKAARDVALTLREQAEEAVRGAKRQSDAYKQAARDSVVAQRQANRDIAAMQRQAERDAKEAAKSPLRRLDTAIGQNQYSNVNQALDSVRGVGLGAMAAGAAGGVVLGRGLMNADEMKRTRKALAFSLGSEGEADNRIKELQGVDRSSDFDLRTLTANYNSLLGRGFNGQEAMDLLKSTGDLVARTQGSGENLTAVFQQFSQIKGKGKVGMQDINALSEGGGIPIIKILTEQLGQERIKGVMSGDEPLSADEFFGAFSEGVKQYAGGMKEANDSLRGDLSNLSSALYQASDATNALLSPVRMVIRTFTAVVDFFNALPAPLKAIAAFQAAGGIMLLFGVGGIAVFLSTVGKAVLGFAALQQGIDRLGDTALKNAVKTGGAAVASGAAGTGAAAAGGAGTAGAVAGGATLGGLALAGAVGVAGGVALAGIPHFFWRYFGQGKQVHANIAAGEGVEEKSLTLFNKMRARHTPAAASPSPVTTALASVAPLAPGPAEVQVRAGQSADVDAAQGTVDANQAEIDSLQDQIRDASDKEVKKALREQLVAVQRRMRGARRELAAQRKLATQTERDAKAIERASDKQNKYTASIEEARSDEACETKIAALEAQKEGLEGRRLKALEYQIARLKAEKDYRGALAEANGLDDDDPAHKAAAREIARIHLEGALKRAAIERDAPSKGDLASMLRGGKLARFFGGVTGNPNGPDSLGAGNPFGVGRSGPVGRGGPFSSIITSPLNNLYVAGDPNAALSNISNRIGGGYNGFSARSARGVPFDALGNNRHRTVKAEALLDFEQRLNPKGKIELTLKSKTITINNPLLDEMDFMD